MVKADIKEPELDQDATKQPKVYSSNTPLDLRNDINEQKLSFSFYFDGFDELIVNIIESIDGICCGNCMSLINAW